MDADRRGEALCRGGEREGRQRGSLAKALPEERNIFIYIRLCIDNLNSTVFFLSDSNTSKIIFSKQKSILKSRSTNAILQSENILFFRHSANKQQNIF
jgi:hypothetical protein